MRSSQAVRGIRAFAQRYRRIEFAAQRIIDDAVLDAVERVAGIERGLMQHGKFLFGNEAGRILVRGLRGGDELKALGGAVITGIAGDDAFEIVGIALRFHERLPASARAAGEIRKLRRRAIERGHDGFAAQRRFVHGAIAEIDQLLGMAGREARRVSRVAGVGGRGCVSFTQRGRQRGVLDKAVPAAVADFLEFAVPAGKRQPGFGFDVGIGRRLDGQLDAAEGGQIGEAFGGASMVALKLPAASYLR